MGFDMQQHKRFLQYVCACSNQRRRLLLQNSSGDEVRAFCNVLLNICAKDPDCVTKLKPYQRSNLRKMFKTQAPTQRRTLLLQNLASTVNTLLKSSRV